MLKQFALIMVSNSVGKIFGQILPTWANWVKILSFRAPCELICSASVDWTAFKTGPKQAPKSIKSIEKITNNSPDSATSSQSRQTKKSKAKQNQKVPKRQLSVRNIFLSYPWMAARKFYGVTGQLKGHSQICPRIQGGGSRGRGAVGLKQSHPVLLQ